MSSDFQPSSTPSLQPAELPPRTPPKSARPSVAAAGALGALLGALLVVVWSEAGPRSSSSSSPATASMNDWVDPGRNVIAAVGTVELDPAHMASITTQNSGVVIGLSTFEGDRVEKGTLLAVIEPDRSELDARRPELPRDTYQLLSPIAGTVVERALLLTQNVGSELLAFKIADLDYLKVNLRLPQPGASDVRSGDSVEVRPFAAHDVALAGRVGSVTGSDAALGATLSVHVLDPHHHLRAGQSVRTRVFASGKAAPRR